MHFSLLVIADGTKTLQEIMEPFNEEIAWEDGRDNDVKWDCYLVGGRYRGLIKAKIGAYGERTGFNFGSRSQGIEYGRQYMNDRYDVARVRDIDSLDSYSIHDILTPDGVWRTSEFYVPDGINGKYFFENTWFHESFLERLKEQYPNCLAFIIDCHV